MFLYLRPQSRYYLHTWSPREIWPKRQFYILVGSRHGPEAPWEAATISGGGGRSEAGRLGGPWRRWSILAGAVHSAAISLGLEHKNIVFVGSLYGSISIKINKTFSGDDSLFISDLSLSLPLRIYTHKQIQTNTYIHIWIMVPIYAT